MDSKTHFDAGQLQAAIEACAAELRKDPANINHRYFFCELLCFQGNWERADKQLETLAQQDQKQAVQVALFRQLIRSELARHDVFGSGRVPGFFADPTPALTLHLRALVALRDGNAADATALLAQAEEARPAVAGTCDGSPFDDFRDVDDATASFFEVLTSAGQYYWLPFEAITVVKFSQPRRPRDLIWRPAHFELRELPSVDGFVPALYAATSRSTDDELRLGRATDWSTTGNLPVRGAGLRLFLVGENDKSILELNDIQIDSDG